MITDVFFDRYSSRVVWATFNEPERRLCAQAAKLITEQLFPRQPDSTLNKIYQKHLWSVHDALCTEMGLDILSNKYFIHNNLPFENDIQAIISNFLNQQFQPNFSPDLYMKYRISLIELAFRRKSSLLSFSNSDYAASPSGGLIAQFLSESSTKGNEEFRSLVDELNIRLSRSGAPLNYHNGFIQLVSDDLITEKIERPFWGLIADTKWKNVDIDLKLAFDLRDSMGRDPAWYGARALESAIKIIVSDLECATRKEKSAYNYIDSLLSDRSGNFIKKWEADSLKLFFEHVRNPLGHGPGKEDMPELTDEQTDWALEYCMTWIRNLIRRMNRLSNTNASGSIS